MPRRLNVLLVALAVAAPLALLAPAGAEAQSAAAKILEKSRAQAREIEELRKVLNGPDQNMRLATFDAMVKSGDETLKQIAYEAGLLSADSVMRAMAFKALVMSQENLLLVLTVDPGAPKPVQQSSADHLGRNGTAYALRLGKKNDEAGTFEDGPKGCVGQVTGLEVVVGCGGANVALTLQDDNSLAGVVRIDYGKTQFLAKTRLR